jgi:hypothetical protein
MPGDRRSAYLDEIPYIRAVEKNDMLDAAHFDKMKDADRGRILFEMQMAVDLRTKEEIWKANRRSLRAEVG